jgi:hypothetical protein
MAILAHPKLRALFPAIAFLAYVVALLWPHDLQGSTWQIEQEGGIPIAVSYLYYDRPFVSIDTAVWDAIVRNEQARISTDSLLDDVAQGKIRPGALMPTSIDGSGLGYSLFAIASLYMFGPHTFSLILGFAILLGVSAMAFLLRFRDDRALAIPIVSLALTLMLLTPLATRPEWADQVRIGGYRFFVIAGIIPTIHIILELIDSTRNVASRSTNTALLALQTMLLVGASLVRMSASYFIGSVALAVVLSAWSNRNDASRRRPLVVKTITLLAAASAVYLGSATLLAEGAARATFGRRLPPSEHFRSCRPSSPGARSPPQPILFAICTSLLAFLSPPLEGGYLRNNIFTPGSIESTSSAGNRRASAEP